MSKAKKTAKQPSNVTKPEELAAKQQKVDQLKNVIIQGTVNRYHAFANEIRSLPLQADDLKNILFFMNTGILWFKEAVGRAQISIGEPAKEGKKPTKKKAKAKKPVDKNPK